MRTVKAFCHTGDEALLDSLVASDMPADARTIYRGRNIVAVLDSPSGPLCIKSYGVPGFIKSFIYGRLRTPKAERAYINARRLAELGIDTPEPVGMAVCYNKIGITRSYYVCRFYTTEWQELRGIEKRTDFPQLAAALAAFIATLHDKGVLMKDFSQGNTLFRLNPDGSYSFALIDINRMEFGIADRSKLLANFRSTLDTEAGMDLLADEYIRITGADTSLKATIMDIYRRRRRAIERKKRVKKLLRHKQ